MSVQLKRITAEEFLTLPETNLPNELINGEHIQMPSPVPNHQFTVLAVAKLIESAMAGGQLFISPLDVYLDEFNVLQPDVLWISAQNMPTLLANRKFISGAPDLVVEVLSPGSVLRDRRDKFQIYERYGVREYWIVDPEPKLIEIWQGIDGRFNRIDVCGVENPCISPLLGDIEVKAIFPE